MEVSDRIVIVNHGKVEQVGDPHELYDRPANDFVMGFVGPVTRLGDTLIRPHDIEIRLEPNGTTHSATIAHIARLGFEVRIDLALEDGQETSVQVTREESRVLDLEPGKSVFVRPRPTATIAPEPAPAEA